MTYRPAWNAQFSKPLVNQTIALVQRDQSAAVVLVNSSLMQIGEFHKGPGARTALPWLTISADKTEFDSVSPYTRSYRSMLALDLDVGQFDGELARDNAQDYARVLDTIVTTATGADWITPLPIQHETVPAGVTSPVVAGSVKEVFVESHRYGLVTQAGIQSPILRVTLTVLFALQET
ncbi:MAG: hypothetical protein ACRD10_02900 [Terriglobia bacterium]